MLIYLLAIFSVYFIFLILLILGWQEATTNYGKGTHKYELVSVVVAVRNEEGTLPDLISTLARQSYPHNHIEIILVDDHSTDQSSSIISNLQQTYSLLKITTTKCSGTGKKRALTEGIRMATGEIILTTDADCLLPPNWIQGMLKSFRSNTNMVVGMVKIKSDDTFLHSLQFLEFASIMGAGISFLGWRFPIMCNGASLAFRRSIFEEVDGYTGNFHISSGDDEFLMRKIEKKYPGTIEVISEPDCVVRTHPMETIAEFFQQRVRWAGKWKANDSFLARVIALFVLTAQISWLITLVSLVFSFRSELALIVIIKIMLEGFFLWRICKYFHEVLPKSAFFVLQVLYPLYVICIGTLSQFKKYNWKDREASFSR
jgi:poly-beta-1,6-N-acetyl-D-glucosamine synthase